MQYAGESGLPQCDRQEARGPGRVMCRGIKGGSSMIYRTIGAAAVCYAETLLRTAKFPGWMAEWRRVPKG